MATGQKREITREEFDKAKEFRLNFGKHQGKTLNQIAETDEGLTYLDWCVGNIDQIKNPRNEYQDKMHDAFVTFLQYPVVARDLENALDAKRDRQR